MSKESSWGGMDHLLVLFGLIVGLGIAQLLLGVGRWLGTSGWSRADVLPLAWVFVLILVLVLYWWRLKDWDHAADVGLLSFFVLLIFPISTLTMASVMFPSDAELTSRAVAVGNWFIGQHRAFFGAGVVGFVALAISDFILDLEFEGFVHRLFYRGLPVAICIGGFTTTEPVAHVGLVSIAALAASWACYVEPRLAESSEACG